jgi:hypothetical protein
VPFQEHSRSENLQGVKTPSQKTDEVCGVESQQDVSPRRCRKKNWPVFSGPKHCRAIGCPHIANLSQSLFEQPPLKRGLAGQFVQIASHFGE